MTADEIRTIKIGDFADEHARNAFLLREIAAQLAELNDKLDSVISDEQFPHVRTLVHE